MNLVTFRPQRNWNPSVGLRALENEFDRFFKTSCAGSSKEQATAWVPAWDIRESQDDYTFAMDVPGISKDDLVITVAENVLSVKGSRNSDSEENKDSFHRVERWSGAFERSVCLPKDADGEAVEAHYADGVLTVTVNKAEKAKPKNIEVKVS